MIEKLEQIKRIRKKLGINQKELADKAGVSQSLIAKIEANKIDPTFTRVKQIFQALEELREKEDIKAKQVMNKKVSFAKSTDKVKDVVKIMKKKGISQIPVLHKEKVIGLITETGILRSISNNPENILTTVEKIMNEVPPIVSPKAGMKVLLELLKDSQIVLVAEKGDIKGIISKSDLLERIE